VHRVAVLAGLQAAEARWVAAEAWAEAAAEAWVVVADVAADAAWDVDSSYKLNK